MRPLQNLRFERISKIASHHAQIILKYFQALEKRMAKKCAKDEDFAKVSQCWFFWGAYLRSLGFSLPFYSERVAEMPNVVGLLRGF